MKLSKEAKVGILTVVSIGLFYYGFNYLKGIDFFNPTKTYYATYQNVGGLGVSNPVTVNGFSVGRVSNISIDQSRGHVIVQFDVKSSIILGDSASAILTSDLLGSKELKLDVGNLERPMESGDTISGVLDKGLESLLAEGESIAVNLEETIKKVNSILDTLSQTTSDIKSTFANVEAITSDLKGIEYEKNFNKLMESIDVTLNTVETIASSVPPIMSKIDGFADTLNNIKINEALLRADTAIGTINRLLSKIEQGEGNIGRLMKDDSLYNNLNATLRDLDAVLIRLNENPRHFFAPFGRKKKKNKN
ncbi:MAG: MlaD family protein [Bacteroidota bacterium]